MRDVRPVPSFNSHNKATDNNNNSKRPQAREKLKLHTLRPAVVLYKGMYAHACFFIGCHLSDRPGPTTGLSNPWSDAFSPYLSGVDSTL